MTKVFDDLEIFSTKPEENWIRGQLDYSVIDDEPNESFIITLNEKLGVEDRTSTLFHELEHYVVTKAILELGAMAESDLLFSSISADISVRLLPYEGAHSNPSHLEQTRLSTFRT